MTPSEKLIQTVARRSRELRKARGWTQEDMRQFGFAYRYYQRIEAGEKNLSLRIVARLAAAFKVAPVELFR